MAMSLMAKVPRSLKLAVIDIGCWSVALLASAALVSHDRLPVSASFVLLAGLVATALHVAGGFASGIYRGRFRSGSTAEARVVVSVVAAVSLFVLVCIPMARVSGSLLRIGFASAPWSIVLVAAPLAAMLMIGMRGLPKTVRERYCRSARKGDATLVFGAGEVGEHLVRRMLVDSGSAYNPVGFLDDDPAKGRQIIHSCPVLGTRYDLETVARATGATTLVVAVADSSSELLHSLMSSASTAGLKLVIVPTLNELLSGADQLSDLRSISIDDLIGREPVDIGSTINASYIRGRRVLVTGAGGSIGSELCRQLARLDAAELIMLDRDETGLQQAQMAVSGHGLLDTREVVLADIRDGAALTSIFLERRPEVVFHAAALKHLPMLEQYPLEAWKTNVLGTLNVLDAAEAAGVETFVNVSTDKAANPCSVLGASKRLAERLTADFARRGARRYISVRFGNVLGSRGSLIPVFQTLLEARAPLTVTDPEATRYFMSIPEACHLVLQAGGIGDPGQVLILDMGEPVRILDIANRMISLSAQPSHVVFTGLRPGEKLHEELIGEGETDCRPVHPKISHTSVPALAADDLDPARFLNLKGLAIEKTAG
jgi:dTDP-glucose 4,6-dehydratase